ncbi:Histone H5 [Brachionus plicatilis]|uniref:Histone H5 n=1 Tax=Brachionus plicatilis TaxID=10195 RepID=A0A3M7QWL8_BRAPC|nr:Histone H5 [Brachionus plicatilis]
MKILKLIMNKNGTLSNSFVIEKSDLEKWIEMTESSKLKLIRAQHDEDADPASDKLLFESNYSNKEINILDICTGNLNHVNLKQVAVLESNLAQLYKKLTRLGESFKTVKNLPKNEAQSNSSPLPFHNQSLRSQIDESAKVTSDCCQKLFDLSMLVPSAPWSAIKKSPVEQLSQESLMEKLKSISLPKSKQISVEILLKSLFVSSNYHYHMKSVECAALNEELDFYRSCYSLQKNYVESVTELFRAKYEQFVKELSETVRDPLRILIDKFWLMKESSTEENLKEFLGIFKNYVSTFNKVISNFDSIPNSETITRTFNQLLVQLDTEVLKLNERCLSKKESFNLESIDLKKLSLESDEILIDYIKPSPKSSPEK